VIRQDDTVTVQIHTLDLTQGKGGNVIKGSVPVIAVWVPARLARAWINQNQPAQAE
jgi:hypothetical protein